MSDKICYYVCILELLIFIIHYYGTIVVYYIIVCRLRAWSGPSYEIKIYYIIFYYFFGLIFQDIPLVC